MIQLWICEAPNKPKTIEISEVPPWYEVALYHVAYRWPFYHWYNKLTVRYWNLTRKNPVEIPITEEIDKSIRINLWKESPENGKTR